MLDPDLMSFICSELPPPPARVLEVGAGSGELATALSKAGYQVTAIDPVSEAPHVQRVTLDQLEAPRGSFDAGLAVVSLHHVEPLDGSCRRLADVMRPGGRLVVDEFDVDRFDETAAQWWLSHRAGPGDELRDPVDVVADRRAHLHSLGQICEELARWFDLVEAVRGPYLYRWGLPPECRTAEAELVAAGRLPPTGARFVGIRR